MFGRIWKRCVSRTRYGALLVAAAALPFALTACNTVEGAGEDVEAVGEAIDETAEDASN